MATYLIHEDNIDRLEKQLASIEKKCKAYGCEFHYRRTGNVEYVDQSFDDIMYCVKYIEVEAEGTALINGWRFVATIEHKSEGNIVRQLDMTVEVPECYYHTAPICEHCNSSRTRKDTYLVYNEKTQEFKQVGKTCLKSYTGGLDADQAARYISWFDTLIKGSQVPTSAFGHVHSYFNIKQILVLAHQAVLHFGYKKRETEYLGEIPTADLVKVFYFLNESKDYGKYLDQKVIDMFDMIDVSSKTSENFAAEALKWLKTNSATYGYFANLKAACLDTSGFADGRDLGIIVSLVPSYMREQKCQKETQTKKELTWAGKVGEKVSFPTTSIRVISSYEDFRWGTSFFYSLKDDKDNVYTWSTETYLDPTKTYFVTGTIKQLNEYKGTAQTAITRCKATEIKVEPQYVVKTEAEEALEAFMQWVEA